MILDQLFGYEYEYEFETAGPVFVIVASKLRHITLVISDDTEEKVPVMFL